jgi:hypothetical protein
MAETLGNNGNFLKCIPGVAPIEGLDLVTPEKVFSAEELAEVRQDLAEMDSFQIYEEEDPDDPSLVG